MTQISEQSALKFGSIPSINNDREPVSTQVRKPHRKPHSPNDDGQTKPLPDLPGVSAPQSLSKRAKLKLASFAVFFTLRPPLSI